MRVWIIRGLILLFLLALAPVAEWLQWTLGTSFGEGDGVITSFYINHVVAALPTLAGFIIAGLCLWWLRQPLSNKLVMLIVCSLTMSFGVLNFAAEIVLSSRPNAIADDKHHRAPHPYIAFKGTTRSPVHNALGYGGKVPAVEKKPGEYRVFFLGGSTVRFGSPPIPELVEQRFHADGYSEVQVFNFGVSGSNTSMELARLVFEVLEYQPDLIVSYSGGNDIHTPIVGDPRPGYPFTYLVWENHPLMSEDYPLLALNAYSSHLIRMLGGRSFIEKFTHVWELRRAEQWETAVWRERLAETYVDKIETSARIASGFDSDFIAFLQPSLLTKQNPAEAERALLEQVAANTEKTLGVNLADWKLHDETIRAEIRSRMSAIELKGFRFVDMTAAFDEVGTRTYRDLIHTEQPANFLIADQIYEVLHGVWAEHAHSDLSD